jgi:hypothetical protein
MTVAASIRAAVSVSQSGSAAFGKSPAWDGAFDEVISLVDGTGANQCDLAYMEERTVNSASNDDIDLAGVLSSALGATITAAKLVAICIINKRRDGSVNTTNLTIGGGSNTVPGFANALAALKPGGMFLMASPDAAGLATVTAGAGDIIRVANSSGAQAKYMIAILARSA